ncbi:MAG: hypothetical protein ACREFP_06355 [Acetobacteraceae bacterium]
MSHNLRRSLCAAIVVGALPLATAGCVVPQGPYGYNNNPGYNVGYFEPAGVHYGGWTGGYDVGPARGGVVYHPPAHGPAQHAWRPPPARAHVPSPSWGGHQGGQGHGGR